MKWTKIVKGKPETLPDDGVVVWVTVVMPKPLGSIRVTDIGYRAAGEWTFLIEDKYYSEEVTHWQPLRVPELPGAGK